jgi:hypothetical protein
MQLDGSQSLNSRPVTVSAAQTLVQNRARSPADAYRSGSGQILAAATKAGPLGVPTCGTATRTSRSSSGHGRTARAGEPRSASRWSGSPGVVGSYRCESSSRVAGAGATCPTGRRRRPARRCVRIRDRCWPTRHPRPPSRPSDPTPDRGGFVSAVRTQPRNRRTARDGGRVRPLDPRARLCRFAFGAPARINARTPEAQGLWRSRLLRLAFRRGRYCYFEPFEDLAPSDPAR